MVSMGRKFAGMVAAALVTTLVVVSGAAPVGADIVPNPGGTCDDKGFTIIRDGHKVPCEPESVCTGDHYQDLNHAKDSYESWCGQEWRHDSGVHQCEWQADGWICAGPHTLLPGLNIPLHLFSLN